MKLKREVKKMLYHFRSLHCDVEYAGLIDLKKEEVQEKITSIIRRGKMYVAYQASRNDVFVIGMCQIGQEAILKTSTSSSNEYYFEYYFQ